MFTNLDVPVVHFGYALYLESGYERATDLTNVTKAELVDETGMKPAHAARLLAAVAMAHVVTVPATGASPESTPLSWLFVRNETREFLEWKIGRSGKFSGVDSFIDQRKKKTT